MGEEMEEEEKEEEQQEKRDRMRKRNRNTTRRRNGKSYKKKSHGRVRVWSSPFGEKARKIFSQIWSLLTPLFFFP